MVIRYIKEMVRLYAFVNKIEIDNLNISLKKWISQGWIPLTMEQKRDKEIVKKEKKQPTELISTYSMSAYEKEWQSVRIVAETYGKEIQFRNTLSPIIKKKELNAAK